jgi:phosphohistidine phosphatase SixA
MKLYLFRHAEKASPFHPDPSLSDSGMQQAMALLEKVKNAELPRPTHLWVSPRLRARQSFQALSNGLQLPFQIFEGLDEKMGGENRHQFRERIDKILQNASTQTGVLYICSHYDWLEESLQLIACDTDLMHEIQSHWTPLQYVGLQLKENTFEFLESKRITP